MKKKKMIIIMHKNRIFKYVGIAFISLMVTACIPSLVRKTENKTVPASYKDSQDTTNSGKIKWKFFFKDTYLTSLIDSALINNQNFNIAIQDTIIAKNEVKARKGQYLPFINLGGAAAIDKQGRYTRLGAIDATSEIKPGRQVPTPLPDLLASATASWQVDIWKQLRNSRKSAQYRFLASKEGRNFMQTLLVADIANSYYELMALDNQLDVLKRNIEIQTNALEIIKQLKTGARVTELAVRRFEAEVAKNQSRQYYVIQQIVEMENRINFLVGRFPRPVQRNSQNFSTLAPDSMYAGIPSQLLENRPDIRQAELQLSAAKLDVKVAKANFYPVLMITGGAGFEAFSPKFLVNTPESMLYYMAGQLIGPVVNRNAIKANYYTSNARQTQAVWNYQRTVLNAYTEVYNQLSNISNLKKSYTFKTQQVEALNRSINIAIGLFQSARADYVEVLLVQRDALESRFEIIETKKQQMNAMVNIYQALGGGW
jgi:outer membrane protein, multidrug efflux system